MCPLSEAAASIFPADAAIASASSLVETGGIASAGLPSTLFWLLKVHVEARVELLYRVDDAVPSLLLLLLPMPPGP
jgi:hypothetical protein